MHVVVSTVNVVKASERQIINRQVEEFLARGGKIESIETVRRSTADGCFLPVANPDDSISADDFFE